jgi:hypothetical protein
MSLTSDEPENGTRVVEAMIITFEGGLKGTGYFHRL